MLLRKCWPFIFFVSPRVLQRKRILRGSSALLKALYHTPSESQILTLALDGQVSYWEVIDGKEVRAISVGKHSKVASLDVSNDGESFATGGEDSVARVRSCERLKIWYDLIRFLNQFQIWRYCKGDLAYMGMAECGNITKVKISPRSNYVLAATTNGGIIAWTLNWRKKKQCNLNILFSSAQG